MAGEYRIHGEITTSGTSATPIVLYDKGSAATVRTLLSTEFLHITDIKVMCEAGGDFSVYLGADTAGKRIAWGNLAANGGLVGDFREDFTCPRGVIPTFIGGASGRNSLIIEGFITEA